MEAKMLPGVALSEQLRDPQSRILPEPIVHSGDNNQPTLIIRPMLTTAKKNFKTVRDCPTIKSGYVPPKTVREELNVPGSRCFLLRSVLTPAECAHYIYETEEVGYEDLTSLFPVEYRSNDRILSKCETLVECLWKRIEPFLTRKEVVCIRPVGFGNEGTWKPVRLNECCKFGKYKSGGHFSPHLDGPWVPNEEESSVFTVVIYLNSDFEGGCTSFLSEEGVEVCSVSPRAGTALIFNHDTLHEGKSVTKGTKYIIRTEIMFRRADTEMLPNPEAYTENENYIKTVALYKKSWQLEQAGDTQGFTDTYLEGLALQCQMQRTVGKDSVEIFEQILPYELYMKVLGYLSPKELCNTMRVCKMWYTMCMDGELWYNLYRKKWRLGMKLHAKVDSTAQMNIKIHVDPVSFTKDWYGRYKQRATSDLDKCKKVTCVDLGSYLCKFAMVDRDNSKVAAYVVESVVASVPGVHDLHLRRRQYERYFCGKDAKERYPGDTVDVIEKGVPVHCELLPQLVFGFFVKCRTRPMKSPVIVLEPPGLWDDTVRANVAASFLQQLQCPSVTFLSSAVAILAGLNITCGIVLSVGRTMVTCAAVCDGNECPNPLFCETSTNSCHLADMVEKIALRFTNRLKLQTKLMARVVIAIEQQDIANELEDQLHKKDSRYHIIWPDAKLAGVKGGCSIAMLAEFWNIKQFAESATEDIHLSFTGFYRYVMSDYYWLRSLPK